LALKYMSDGYPGKTFTAKEISEKYSGSFDEFSKVLQIMNHHDVLHAEKGSTGGYRIVKDLSKVNLFQLVEMISGPITVTNCLTTSITCNLVKNCQIMSPILNFNERLIDLCKSIPLRELLYSRHDEREDIIREQYELQLKEV